MIKIYTPTEITTEIVDAFARLIPQLSSDLPLPTKAYLQTIIESKGTSLFLAQTDDGKIVGTLSLVVYKIPTGKKAWIEDIIVDQNSRGKGIARALINAALDKAKDEEIEKVDLTSSPSRKAAHALYLSSDFEKRETCVFRYRVL